MAQSLGRGRRVGAGSRREYWQRLMEAWSRSGLSQAEFCRQRGVSAASFSWWKGRLRRRKEEMVAAGGGPAAPPPAFLPVRIVSPSPAGSAEARGEFAYEVVLRGGARVRVPGQFEAEGLRRLVEVLEAVGC